MPPFSTTTFCANDANVFGTGKYATILVKVEGGETCNTCSNKSSSYTSPLLPPKELLIATPSEEAAGEFPVLMLLHGYLLYNSFYSQLIQHIASHGYIVIAPQVNFLILHLTNS